MYSYTSANLFTVVQVDKSITPKQSQIIIISGLIIGYNVVESSRPKLNLARQNIFSASPHVAKVSRLFISKWTVHNRTRFHSCKINTTLY